MPARVFPAKGKDTLALGRSFLSLQDNLLLICARPSADKSAIILQLRETGGRESSLAWNDPLSAGLDLHSCTHAKAAFEVNVLEEKIANIESRLTFAPFETKFVKIVF
jgi:hypothetical protein